MSTLQELVRPNIWNLNPYSSARDEFSGKGLVFLDANENPFGAWNRYPDPYQIEIKEKLSGVKLISPDMIFLGNGSDEVIDLLFRIFCEPGVDKALTFSPTYGMYQVSADVNNVELINIPLNEDFQINATSVAPYIDDANTKLMFICSPNNPTGNLLNDLESVISTFPGIVAIDEAYIDFAKKTSWKERLDEFPNLIVLQTFSKAWGLAGVRLGMAFANTEIIKLLNKVKPPYNISGPNQKIIVDALSNMARFQQHLDEILDQKAWLENELNELEIIKRIYPSDANFLFVVVNDATAIYERLVAKGIVTRNRNSVVRNCLRITVGSPHENEALVNELKNIQS